MSVMEDDVLDALSLLSYSDLSEDELKKAVDGGPQCPEFTKFVEWLTKELQCFRNLDEHVNAISGPEDSKSFLLELSSFLKELGCPYESLTEGSFEERLKSNHDRYLLLDFLTSELLAARMHAVEKPSTTNMAVTILESPTAAALKNMLIALSFPKPPSNIPPAVLFSKVLVKVNEMSGKLVKDPLFTGKLSEKQWTALEKVNNDLKEEYDIRRQMLLKRLDVTIQSFQWSDKTRGKEDSLAILYTNKRNLLKPEPSVRISDLLSARKDLALIEKTSNSNVRKNTTTSLNKVIIGRVPDRGGRPSEQQPPPPEMPSWAPRASQPQGGGGGWRGGGGGGRGNRVQGGWNAGGDNYSSGGGGGGRGGFHQSGGRGGGFDQGGPGSHAGGHNDRNSGGQYGGHNHHQGGRGRGGRGGRGRY